VDDFSTWVLMGVALAIIIGSAIVFAFHDEAE